MMSSTTQQHTDVIFVIEGTALCGAYLHELRTQYIIPTLEHFSGPIDEKDCGSDSNYCLYGLVVFHAADILPGFLVNTVGPLNTSYKLLHQIDRIRFTGGHGEAMSSVGEGLATALECLEDLAEFRSTLTDVTAKKHIILICNCKPYGVPVSEAEGTDEEFRGKTVEQLAAYMIERDIHLSIMSPRKIPGLIQLFDHSGGDISNQKGYARDMRHLILLNGFNLKVNEERPTSPARVNQEGFSLTAATPHGLQMNQTLASQQQPITSSAPPTSIQLTVTAQQVMSNAQNQQPIVSQPSPMMQLPRSPAASISTSSNSLPPASGIQTQNHASLQGNMSQLSQQQIMQLQQQQMFQQQQFRNRPMSSQLGGQMGNVRGSMVTPQQQMNPHLQPTTQQGSQIPNSLQQQHLKLQQQQQAFQQQQNQLQQNQLQNIALQQQQQQQQSAMQQNMMQQQNPSQNSLQQISIQQQQQNHLLQQQSQMQQNMIQQNSLQQNMIQQQQAQMQQGQTPMQQTQMSMHPQGQNPIPQGQNTMQQVQNPMQQAQNPMQQVQNPMQQVQNTLQQVQNPMQQTQNSIQQGQTPMQQSQNSLQQGQTAMQQNQNPMLQGQNTMQQGQNTMQQGQNAMQQAQTPLQQGSNQPQQMGQGQVMQQRWPNQNQMAQQQQLQMAQQQARIQMGSNQIPPHPQPTSSPSLQRPPQEIIARLNQPPMASSPGTTSSNPSPIPIQQQLGVGGQQLQRERRIIWNGYLEWHEKQKGTPEGLKIPRQVPCQVSATVVNNEPEVKGDGWPSKLIMQLIPKQIVGNLGGTYFLDVKTVLFILQNCDALVSLTKVMDSGFAGCVHFTGSGMAQNSCTIKVLILLYSKERHAYLGFIPNDQAGFVDRIRKVIQQQKTQQAAIRQGSTGIPPSVPQNFGGQSGPPGMQGGMVMQGQPNQQLQGQPNQQLQSQPNQQLQGQPSQQLQGQPNQQLQNQSNQQQPQPGLPVSVQQLTAQPQMMSHQPPASQLQQQLSSSPQIPPPVPDSIELERQQNVLKIQQLQQALEQAQQRELIYTQQLQSQGPGNGPGQIQMNQGQLTGQGQMTLPVQMPNQAQVPIQNQMSMQQGQMIQGQGMRAGIPQQRMTRASGVGQLNPGLKHLLQQPGANGPPGGFRMRMPNQTQNPMTQQQQGPPGQYNEDLGILDLLK